VIVKIIRFVALYVVVSLFILSILVSFAVDIVTYPNSGVKQCDVAVVEGWLYDDQIDYFQKQLNSYETIYTIGATFERAREYFPYDNLLNL
jgi:hypothetical protein